MLKVFPAKGTKRIKIHSSDPVSIDGKGTGQLVIDGPAFLWPNDGIGYYHVLIDFLNDWIICKDNLPDIKLYVVQISPGLEERLKTFSPTHYELLKMLPVEQLVNIQSYEKVTFNNIIFCSSEMNLFLTRELGLPRVGTTGGSTNPRFKDWHNLAIKNINNFFEQYKQPVQKGFKLFVSRKEEHQKITEFLSLPESEQKESQKHLYEERSLYRYMDPENEDEIEAFFTEVGYTIINFANMSLKEQVAISSMAEAMAGFHGAGMLNAIFMNDSSRVLLLNTCTINTFYHTELHQLQRDLVCEIPERVGMERLMQDETYRDWFYDIDMAKEFPQFFRKYKAADILDYIKSRGEVFRML